MEETVFHNGKRKVVCTNLNECDTAGGCKNRSLCRLWKKSGIDADCDDKQTFEELTNG